MKLFYLTLVFGIALAITAFIAIDTNAGSEADIYVFTIVGAYTIGALIIYFTKMSVVEFYQYLIGKTSEYKRKQSEDEMLRLKKLEESGIITTEEFTARVTKMKEELSKL
jgi:hypothetical protein